jgi:hypothetical protein
MIAFIGVLFIAIILMGQKLERKISFTASLVALALIFWLVLQLE